MKEVGKKKYPHKHILGIEGLSPPDINYLLNLSEKFSQQLSKEKKVLF